MASKSKKYRFKVIGGAHVDADGTMHETGEVFQSDTRLDKQFANKFELLPAKQVARRRTKKDDGEADEE